MNKLETKNSMDRFPKGNLRDGCRHMLCARFVKDWEPPARL